MAHKKGLGSSRNGRDSNAQRLGFKAFGGQVVPGGTVSEHWIPVGRVGLYVPGGLAVYPSSVVMNVATKQVHGFASNEKEWFALNGTLDGID